MRNPLLLYCTVNNNLLEHYCRSIGSDGDGVGAVGCRGEGDGDSVLHHSLGDSGVVRVVDILGLLVEIAVEVYYLCLTAVNAYTICETVLVEEVESGFHDDMDAGLLGIRTARELVCK